MNVDFSIIGGYTTVFAETGTNMDPTSEGEEDVRRLRSLASVADRDLASHRVLQSTP